jgi:hypothetical protein
MKRMPALAVLLVATVAATAQTRMVGPRADCEAVARIMEDYALAGTRGDAELRLSLWDSEGDLSVIDRMGIDYRVRANFASTRMTMWITIEEICVSGDLAYAVGPYGSEQGPKAGGATTVVNGRYLTVLRRQTDGSWKVYRDFSATK